MRFTRRSALAVVGVVVALAASACGAGSGSAAGGGALTLYNAQHEDLVKALVDGFAKETGIKVDIRSGKDFELANQLVQEGAASPADVFVTENSPAMSLVDGKGRFAKVDDATLGQVPAGFVPSSRNWTGFAARSTVLAYNAKKLTADQVPASLMDLAQPRWKDKIGIAAAGADFQAIVSAVLEVKGEDATRQWLAGLKTNAKVYPGNIAVMKAVNSGELEAGVIYHYYWYKDRAESGANSANTELKFFGGKDPGGFLSISGAGVLKDAKHAAEAQRFVAYLTGHAGQQILADSKALEYPIGKDAKPNPKLKPLTELDPPAVDPAKLNGPKVVELMQQAGLI
ncbi:iron ABC transporter substrate-binding protein [Amycolatopsis sp. SID8362]|uniref:iron ABC transporter substrate-binding protein n=1 Tax=Amycolatopsis sp. SID8362 TaxID=2690346 RepID=UPI00136B8323|nr:iron ABC transporter substrate-binding protein [Amycolatopsis sp. SID8362]NBH03429.1 extracellular solute-binding protein [Amycolatopsis sp. SID8362]NED40129.1 iron ABC transporter substrate-binding protein [Amycolatopsis sp. SID8362]